MKQYWKSQLDLSEFYSDIGKLCGEDCVVEEIKK